MIVPKWLAGTVVVALLVLAVLLWHQGGPKPGALNFATPVAAQTAAAPADAPLVAPRSDVTPADKEARRFARYDKDKDGAITRDEYFASRHKAFAKLDTNHDGKLSFEEWSIKAVAKFDAADADHNGTLTTAEFATTAVKRKPRTKAVCPPEVVTAAAPPADEAEGQ